jgi:hypothetical protein
MGRIRWLVGLSTIELEVRLPEEVLNPDAVASHTIVNVRSQ